MIVNKYMIMSAEKECSWFEEDPPILSASLSITSKCNLRCIYCYASDSNEDGAELETERIFGLVDELNDLGAFGLQITGGEPFLHEGLPEICRYISDRKISIYLITNGTLLSDKSTAWLAGVNFKIFQISLDAISQHNYCRVKGASAWTPSAILDCLSNVSGNIRNSLAISSVLTKQTSGELVDLLKVAGALNATFVVIPLLPTGRGEKVRSFDLSIGKKLSLIQNLFQLCNRFEKRIEFKPIVPPVFYPRDYRKSNLMYKYCSFPYHIVVLPDGSVFPCDGFRNLKSFRVGNIRESSVEELWSSSKLLERIRAIRPKDLKGVCRRCVFLNSCMGGCRAAAYLSFGNLDMPDPFCQKAYELHLFPQDCIK